MAEVAEVAEMEDEGSSPRDSARRSGGDGSLTTQSVVHRLASSSTNTPMFVPTQIKLLQVG